MPSQWIRWRPDTHIYEFSVDFGANWGPLPLDASILTQGTVDPARLPGGGSLPDLGGDNVFTGAVPISLEGPAPNLQFKETDQGTDAKVWRLGVDGTTLHITTFSDVLATLANILNVNRSGLLTVNGGVDVGTGQVSTAKIRIRRVGNNIEFGHTSVGCIGMLGSAASAGNPFITFNAEAGTNPDTYKTRGIIGCGITSDNAGALNFFTADTPNADNQAPNVRASISAIGHLTLDAGITERGRATPQGEWIDIPYAAGNFTATGMTWTVAAGDQLLYKYSIIGKTVTVIFHIQASSLAGTPTATLFMALPAAIQALDQVRVPCQIYNGAGAWRTGCVGTSPSTPRLNITDINQTTTFAVSSDSTYVLGAITYNIA